MKISKSGYKKNSKDKNEPALVIPSNNITMKNVDFPVYGVDDTGYSQMMYPGMDYMFPGNYVYELPMAQDGGTSPGPYISNLPEQINKPIPNLQPDKEVISDKLRISKRITEIQNKIAKGTNPLEFAELSREAGKLYQEFKSKYPNDNRTLAVLDYNTRTIAQESIEAPFKLPKLIKITDDLNDIKKYASDIDSVQTVQDEQLKWLNNQLEKKQSGGDISIPDLSNKGWLSKYQTGGVHQRIYTDPEEFRIANRAYRDSLDAYNLTQNAINFIKNTDIRNNEEYYRVRDTPPSDVPLSYKGILPTKWEFVDPRSTFMKDNSGSLDFMIAGYKKPTEKPKLDQQAVMQQISKDYPGYSIKFEKDKIFIREPETEYMIDNGIHNIWQPLPTKKPKVKLIQSKAFTGFDRPEQELKSSTTKIGSTKTKPIMRSAQDTKTGQYQIGYNYWDDKSKSWKQKMFSKETQQENYDDVKIPRKKTIKVPPQFQNGGWLDKYQYAGSVSSKYDLMRVDQPTAVASSTNVVVPNIVNAPDKADNLKQENYRTPWWNPENPAEWNPAWVSDPIRQNAQIEFPNTYVLPTVGVTAEKPQKLKQQEALQKEKISDRYMILPSADDSDDAYEKTNDAYDQFMDDVFYENTVGISYGRRNDYPFESTRDTLINLTNLPMGAFGFNTIPGEKYTDILGNNYVEIADRGSGKPEDTAANWIERMKNPNDTFRNKRESVKSYIHSKDIPAFYGVENKKFKVGKATDFDPNTIIVPVRNGTEPYVKVDYGERNDDDGGKYNSLYTYDKDGNRLWNISNKEKFLVHSPETGQTIFISNDPKSPGSDFSKTALEEFKKNNPGAYIIALDEGRFMSHMNDPEGLSDTAFKKWTANSHNGNVSIYHSFLTKKPKWFDYMTIPVDNDSNPYDYGYNLGILKQKHGGWLHKYQNGGQNKPTSNFTLPSLDPQAKQSADYAKGWEEYNKGVETWRRLLDERERKKGRALTTEEKQKWLQKAVRRTDGRKTEVDTNDPKWDFMFKDSYLTWDPELGIVNNLNNPVDVTYQLTDLDKEKQKIAAQTRKKEMTPFNIALGATETHPNVQKRASQNANDLVALRILNQKPQGDRTRVEWLNSLTPEEISTIQRSQYAGKLEQDFSSQFSQGVEKNLRNIANIATVGPINWYKGNNIINQPLWTNPDYTQEEAANASALGVLSPLTYPTNLVTGAITGDFNAALQGQRSKPLFTDYRQPEFASAMSNLYEAIYDPWNVVGAGPLGELNLADDAARATQKANNFLLSKQGVFYKPKLGTLPVDITAEQIRRLAEIDEASSINAYRYRPNDINLTYEEINNIGEYRKNEAIKRFLERSRYLNEEEVAQIFGKTKQEILNYKPNIPTNSSAPINVSPPNTTLIDRILRLGDQELERAFTDILTSSNRFQAEEAINTISSPMWRDRLREYAATYYPEMNQVDNSAQNINQVLSPPENIYFDLDGTNITDAYQSGSYATQRAAEDLPPPPPELLSLYTDQQINDLERRVQELLRQPLQPTRRFQTEQEMTDLEMRAQQATRRYQDLIRYQYLNNIPIDNISLTGELRKIPKNIKGMFNLAEKKPDHSAALAVYASSYNTPKEMLLNVTDRLNKSILNAKPGEIVTGSTNTSHNSYLVQMDYIAKNAGKGDLSKPIFLGYKLMNDSGFLSNMGIPNEEIIQYINNSLNKIQTKKGVNFNFGNKPPYIDQFGNIMIPQYGVRKITPQGEFSGIKKKHGGLVNKYQDGGDYNMQRALELGYTPDETGHLDSVDSETGMWLKSKKHPTAWMEYLYGYTLNPELNKTTNVVINPEGYFGDDQLQYVSKYKKGGVKSSGEGYYDYINGYSGIFAKGENVSKKNNWLNKYK